MQALFRYLPQQRKLPAEVRQEAADLLKLKANKKLVQQHISLKSGSVLTLKDLSNIAAAGKDSTRNNLPSFVNELSAKHGKYQLTWFRNICRNCNINVTFVNEFRCFSSGEYAAVCTNLNCTMITISENPKANCLLYQVEFLKIFSFLLLNAVILIIPVCIFHLATCMPKKQILLIYFRFSCNRTVCSFGSWHTTLLFVGYMIGNMIFHRHDIKIYMVLVTKNSNRELFSGVWASVCRKQKHHIIISVSLFVFLQTGYDHF